MDFGSVFVDAVTKKREKTTYRYPELGQLTALIVLRLNNNQLSGTLATELGQLAALDD